jgi:uncharacterized protein (UPF0332 family)
VASTTMVTRLLDLADQLVRESRGSSALRRRAVSTAYYAVFHALAKSCATILLPQTDRGSELYERVYRALDHGPLKNEFMRKDGPLHDLANLRKLGELIVRLQSDRHRADYLPPNKRLFSRNEAQKLIDESRQAVNEIEALGDDDRIALATSLLFKGRPP